MASLLTRGSETVKIFDEITTTSLDGNIITKPGVIGVICKAVVRPLSTDETANNRGENTTTSRYRMRLIGHDDIVGSGAQIEWRGKRWAIEGEAQIYNGSPHTRHVDYVISRS